MSLDQWLWLLQLCSSTHATGKVSRTTELIDSDGHCVWYGQCLVSPDRGYYNCFYPGPAKPLLDAEGEALFREMCPTMLNSGKLLDALRSF